MPQIIFNNLKPQKELFKNQLYKVFERLEAAIAKSGRQGEDISLVAVSKTCSMAEIALIAELWQESKIQNLNLNFGICFGENYVQEALEKQEQEKHLRLNQSLANFNWHFMGHIQSNKVKAVAQRFQLLHAVDSLKLARNLQKELCQRATQAGEKPQIQEFLIQVNIGEEAQKHGVPPEDILAFTEAIQEFEALKLMGLMCIPPASNTAEESRKYFLKLRQINDKIKSTLGLDLPHLSMGMSADFEVAIAEGASIIRIGSDIFGARQY